MDKSKYIVKVYNTFTKEYEKVEVDKKVFETYRRSEWNIDKNEKKHFANEILFSSLKGGEQNTYENFKEFINYDNIPENYIEEKFIIEKLESALEKLSCEEIALIKAVFYDEKSCRQYARERGVSHTAAHKRKNVILRKLRKLLKL